MLVVVILFPKNLLGNEQHNSNRADRDTEPDYGTQGPYFSWDMKLQSEDHFLHPSYPLSLLEKICKLQ